MKNLIWEEVANGNSAVFSPARYDQGFHDLSTFRDAKGRTLDQVIRELSAAKPKKGMNP